MLTRVYPPPQKKNLNPLLPFAALAAILEPPSCGLELHRPSFHEKISIRSLLKKISGLTFVPPPKKKLNPLLPFAAIGKLETPSHGSQLHRPSFHEKIFTRAPLRKNNFGSGRLLPEGGCKILTPLQKKLTSPSFCMKSASLNYTLRQTEM